MKTIATPPFQTCLSFASSSSAGAPRDCCVLCRDGDGDGGDGGAYVSQFECPPRGEEEEEEEEEEREEEREKEEEREGEMFLMEIPLLLTPRQLGSGLASRNLQSERERETMELL